MNSFIAAFEKCIKPEPLEVTREEELRHMTNVYRAKSSNLIKLTVQKDLKIMELEQKLQRIHDILFDRQKEVSDGVYLELMNSLM
jgi:16S rRNA U1498 N3-methylase RsmE